MTTRFSFHLNPAYNKFLETLAAAQQNNETIERMQSLMQTTQTRLDEQWMTLNELSYQGMEQTVCSLLDVFLREWSGMQALTLIVDLEAWVDPYDQGVQNAFWGKLTRQHAWLESRLLLPFDKGRLDRKMQSVQDSWNLVETHIQSAEKGIERQFALNEKINGWVADAHGDARASLKVAIDAANETRQAVSSFVEPAVTLVKSMDEFVQQTFSASSEKALDRVDHRRTMRRLWIVVGIFALILAAYLFVYIGLQFLY